MTLTSPSVPPATEGGLDLAAVGARLSVVLDEPPAAPLTATLVAGGRSNPTYALDDGRRAWILRRPPRGERVSRSAHDVLREARVIGALAGTAVPVPTVVDACADTGVLGVPYYVMDRLSGVTYRTHADTARLTPAGRGALAEAMVDTLVALHSVDPAAVGLGGLGRPDGYLARQLARWERQWTQVRTRAAGPAEDHLAEVLRRLHASLPDSAAIGIVHGDYKIDNVMVAADDPGRVLGVLDWEMATLGDTLADVGFLISCWDEPGRAFHPVTQGATAHQGFPSAAEMQGAYAERRGIEVGSLDWYVVFSDLKTAVILEQIHARHLRGETVGDGFDDVGDMVPMLLARALEQSGDLR